MTTEQLLIMLGLAVGAFVCMAIHIWIGVCRQRRLADVLRREHDNLKVAK